MPKPPRISAVDAVKGIAIVLVVYGHVAQGVAHRGWWSTPAYAFQERFIYSFHMAAFFFASGLFVAGSIARSGAGQFIVQRLRTVLWPYLACVAAYSTEAVFGANAAARHDFVHSILIPALTGEASWFLPTLFLCLLLAVLTQRLPAWLRFALALATNLLWPATGIRIVDSAAHYFVFLAAGEWVNRRVEGIVSVPRWRAMLGSLAAVGLVAFGNWSPMSSARVIVIMLGLAGTLALFLLARATEATAFDRAAVWCGEASLGIFVLHPLFQGATRLVLARITRSHAVLPNVLIPTLVAVAIPGLLWHCRERLRIGFVFVFPWGEPKRSETAQDHAQPVLATQTTGSSSS
jgi:fucose 4-O-acetylase-like acetyltransferase